DGAMLPHETEVQEPHRKEQDDRRAEARIVLLAPKRHDDVKKAVSEEKAGCGQARPNEAPATPHGDQEGKPNHKRVGAIDRQRCQGESSFRSELADQVLGVADKEITPSE